MKIPLLPWFGGFFRRTFLVRFVLPIITLSATPDLPAQIFPNGGFEDGTSSGWTLWPTGASVQGTDKQEGNFGAQLTVSGTLVAERELNLLPGLSATISGFMKSTLSGSGRKAQLDLVIVDANDGEEVINFGLQTAGSIVSYRRCSLNQWIPLGTKSTKLRVTVVGAPSTAYIDGFSLGYTTGRQLLANRRFSDGLITTPETWKKTGACSLSTTEGRAGSGDTNAGAVTPGTGNHHISQLVPMSGGQTVTVRGFMKTVNMGSFTGKMEFRCMSYNSVGTVVTSGTYTIATQGGTTDYGTTAFQQTITAPAGTLWGQLRLYGIGGAGCTGSIYFDDLSVTEGDGAVKAFPGAEGFGSDTPGARGPAGAPQSDIVIYKVTGTKSTGTGSLDGYKGRGPLRWAFESSALNNKRIFVVFPRAGEIDLTSYDASGNPVETEPITIGRRYVTIGGQTAPGGGVCIKNAGLRIKGRDIIIRGLRFRPGGIHHLPETANLREDARDCLSFDQTGSKVDNIIVDHCSFAWSTDEQIQFYVYGSEAYSNQPIENATISHCLFTEPCDSPWHLVYDDNDKHHAYQMSLDWVKSFSLHHNLFLHGQRRQPEVRSGCELEIVNNLVYNYEQVGTQFWGNSSNPKPIKALVIGNLFLPGPNSGHNPDNGITAASPPTGISFQGNSPPDPGSKFFLLDNYGHYRDSSAEDEWTETTYPAAWLTANNPRASTEAEVLTASGLIRTPVAELLDKLLGEVPGKQNRPGAYPRDAIDARAISDVLTNTNNQLLVIGTLTPNGQNGAPLAKKTSWRTTPQAYRMQDEYANGNGNVADDWGWNNGDSSAAWQGYNIGALPDTNSDGIPNDWEDSDGDGIPNAWENNYSGGAGIESIDVSADGEGGYLNIEIYMNSFIPPNGK